MQVTKAVILAAGEGSRMRPLTYTRPKVMLPIANRPIIEHLISELQAAGIRECLLVVGYHAEQVREYFGDGSAWGLKIRYATQMKQLGTADALRSVQGFLDSNFLLANGDVIVNQSVVRQLIELSGNALSVVELPDVSGLGVVELKDDRIVRLHEKSAAPPTHLANAGLYLFTPDIFPAIAKTPKSPRGEYEITDSIQILIDSGVPVASHRIESWLDLSYPWDLLSANEKLLAKLNSNCQGEVEANVILKGPVSIGKGSLIRSGAYIVGPVIIGKNCDIGPHCFIRPSTAIGDYCHVGAGVEIKNTILMAHSSVPHLSYVGDSVIGANCNLGAGTKIANLKLDKSNVKVNDIDTQRRKLGAIIGDNVQTGINSSINVGTFIGNDAFIGPGALAHGVIAPKSKVF